MSGDDKMLEKVGELYVLFKIVDSRLLALDHAQNATATEPKIADLRALFLLHRTLTDTLNELSGQTEEVLRKIKEADGVYPLRRSLSEKWGDILNVLKETNPIFEGMKSPPLYPQLDELLTYFQIESKVSDVSPKVRAETDAVLAISPITRSALMGAQLALSSTIANGDFTFNDQVDPPLPISGKNWEYFLESETLGNLLVPLIEKFSPQDAKKLAAEFNADYRERDVAKYRSGRCFGTTHFMLGPGNSFSETTNDFLHAAGMRIRCFGNNMLVADCTPDEVVEHLNQPLKSNHLLLVELQNLSNEAAIHNSNSFERWVPSPSQIPDEAEILTRQLIAKALDKPIPKTDREAGGQLSEFFPLFNRFTDGLAIDKGDGTVIDRNALKAMDPLSSVGRFSALFVAEARKALIGLPQPATDRPASEVESQKVFGVHTRLSRNYFFDDMQKKAIQFEKEARDRANVR